ncbi:MAG TPA: PDZ domain-containing protein [Kofleriaceae bacterium]|nr:PDZ domain-containing protein [Kofleriaceae bacterium]
MTFKRKPTILVLAGLAAAAGVAVAVAAPSADKPSRPTPITPHGDEARPLRLGIAAIEISAELRVHFAAPGDRGVLVDSVAADSPAARAGVHVGDVVVEVGGAPATSPQAIRDALRGRAAGSDVAIAVVRDGKPLELHARLDASVHADELLPEQMRGLDDDSWFDLDPDHAEQQIDRMMKHAQELMRRMRHAPPGGGGDRA